MADTSYYQPYESETDSDTDSDSGASLPEEQRAEPTSFLSLMRTAGPSFKNQQDSLLDSRANAYSSVKAAFEAPTPVGRKNPVLPVGSTKFDVTPQSKSTIINISSTDRDRNVYPNPTSFTLHLPRIYRNVTGFDIQQIKFLNAFYYFRNDKFNTFYDYIESCRRIPDLTVYPPRFDKSNTGYKLRVNIREGSYTITTLLQELQYQLNTPPIFFYYPNGFTDFAELFAGSGNFSLGFNQPGSYYFDSLNNVFVPNPTMAYIVSQYFATQNAGLTFYTNENILIAYYYAVIREIFLDPTALPNLTIPPTAATHLQACESIEERVIYNFQGLTDPVILDIINANQNYLDIYRTQNTYLSAPINEYGFRIDSFANRLTITANTLQKSIVNDFTDEKTLLYQAQYINYGLDVNGVQFNNLTTTNQKLLAAFTQMKDYVYSQMANYFAIPFNSYTLEQLVNYDTLYNLRDGVNASNIPNTYIAGCNITPVPDYNLTDSPIIQYDSINTITTQNFTVVNEQVCNVISKDIQLDVEASDVIPDAARAILVGINFLKDSNIQVNPKKRSLDIALNINPYEYTVLKVNSTIDQSIQIETIPKPHRFRYFDYTQACNSSTVTNYFDERNTFEITPYLNQIESNFATTYGIVPVIIPSIFNESSNSADSNAPTYTINISQRTKYATFTTPNDPTVPFMAAAHNFPVNLTLQASAPVTSPLNVYIYGDKSAYLNDAYAFSASTSTPSVLDNLSYNWLYTYTLSNGSTRNMPNELQNSTTYYVIINSAAPTFAFVDFKLYTWYSTPVTSRIVSNDFSGNPSYDDPLVTYYEQPVECNADMYKTGRGIYTNLGYYQINDRVYNKLPINPSLYAGTDPENNAFNDPLISTGPLMGYDASNVSTDLTDYKGYNSAANTQASIYTEAVRCDPTNNYLFNALSPYDQAQQKYITGTNNNGVLTAETGAVYNPTTISERQYKIVHWNDTHFIANQEGQLAPSLCNVSPYIAPYSSNSITSGTLQGYPFENNSVFNSNTLALGAVSGISFLPTDGSWDLDTFMFKSAYLDEATDPNKNIKYIGIFETQTITEYNIREVSLSNAFIQMGRDISSNRPSGSRYYSSIAATNSNFGFDPTLGSYHFFRSTTTNNETQGLISGYTQNSKKMLSRDRNFYSAVAFDSNYNVASFYMLAGSLVPHPEFSRPVAQATYVDGSSSQDCNQFVIVPQQTEAVPSYIQRTIADPYGSNSIYMSQYEQSLPIGTQTIQYQTALDTYDDLDGLYDYSPKGSNLVPLDSLKLTYAFIRDPATGLPNLTFTSGGINNTQDSSNVNTFRSVCQPDSNADGGVLRDLESFSFLNYQNIELPPYNYYWTGGPLLNNSKIVAFTENEYNRFILTLYWKTPVTGPDQGVSNAWHYIYKINTPYKDTITKNDLSLVSTVAGLYQRTDFDPVNSPYKFFMRNDSNYFFFFDSKSPNGPDGIALGPYSARFANPRMGNYISYRTFPTGNVGRLQSAWMNPRGRYCYSWGNSGPIDSDGYPNSALIAFNLDTFRKPLVFPNFGTEVIQMNFGNRRGQYIRDIKSTSDEGIFFIDTTDPYRIHKVQNREFVSSLVSINVINPYDNIDVYNLSIFNVTDTASAFTLPLPVTDPSFNWTIGSDDTFFFQWTINGPYGPHPWKIVGNLRTGLDINTALKSAYQIFYPTMKVGLRKKTNFYNSITDTRHLLYKTESDDSFSPEFNRTYAFYYSNYASMISDFSNSTTGKYQWGKETKFSKADVTNSGYVFNSYIYNILLKANSGNSYIVLRGSRPTESYQTVLRVTAPNRVDFGFNSLTDLISDITGTFTYANIGSTNLLSNYNPQYAITLSNYNDQFKMTNRPFGQGAISGYPGRSITSTGFSNFMTQLVGLYNQYTSNAAILNPINSNVTTEFSNYIYRYWSDILPANALTRATVTDPITYSLLFRSSIPPSYAALDEQWGLGWNLGFAKKDTRYDTVHTAESFYKIFDDYLYLRLNEEQGMNRIDYTAREHLDRTLDPQGTIQTYYGKLILNSFGNYSTTFVGNPVEFNPPIGRLDKIQIQWLDPAGAALTNADCEWNAAIRITENIPTASVGSTIPSLKTGSQ